MLLSLVFFPLIPMAFGLNIGSWDQGRNLLILIITFKCIIRMTMDLKIIWQ